MRRFNALVVDPNPEARAALKELLHHEQLYGECVYKGVFLCSSFIDAITKLTEDDPVDVIFTSNKFPVSTLHAFLKTAREMEGPEGVAYVGIINASEDIKTVVAQGLACGVDGFLIMPCSVVELREITEIARRVKGQARGRLLKVALNLLIHTMIDEIENKVAAYYNSGEVGHYSRRFRAATGDFLSNEAEGSQLYFESLFEIIGAVPLTPKPLNAPKSKRVRRKLTEQRTNEVSTDTPAGRSPHK